MELQNLQREATELRETKAQYETDKEAWASAQAEWDSKKAEMAKQINDLQNSKAEAETTQASLLLYQIWVRVRVTQV